MNEILTVAVQALAHDGRGVGRLGNGDAACPGALSDPAAGTVVFISGGLPGQIVRAQTVRRKPRLIEAVALDILRPAPDAVPPLCPHQRICGGCPLQIMPYARQLDWKRQLALDALTRIGRLDRAMLESVLEAVHPSPRLREFRNKMEFAFGSDRDGRLILGLRRRGSLEAIPVPECVLLPPPACEIVDAVRDLAARSNFAPYVPRPERDERTAGQRDHGFWRFLILRRGRTAENPAPRWWALCVTSPGDRARRAAVRVLGKNLLAAFPALAAFIHEERGSRENLAAGERRVLTLDDQGRERPEAALLHLPLADRLFSLDAASFFQVNTGAAQTLARLARDMLAPHTPPGGGLLDLYCGVGAPGLVLAPSFERVLGLECDARAVALARSNAAIMGLAHCRYLADDAAALDHRAGTGSDPISRTWDTALVDPPRAGLSPRALGNLLRLAPRRLLYISCNPATLARDAVRISSQYSLKRLAIVDLFPHTPHLECLSLWQRAP
ncbi:23S rRNA (uracil(1939)-C(5))-methyltransferase RlmD [Desulfovibrio sp. ZJ369]|uniref:23S rRNA (uracil(1939)-C(5))-methyltransferase RlmD n=1 Tax=Desulfovibrio sp. ZJ369 TaxID=2709793 RepID=UPI0013EA689B|nr:23S rRNA (uracil(1939)-C(5))-methyltransferase RlmD [Desulfovibrio sp. ZJ369]